MNKQKIVPVVVGIIKKEDKYLLTKRSEWNREDKSVKNMPWQFPGGGVEFGESIEHCLRREIKEEVGLELGKVSLLPTIFHEVRSNWHGIFICFVGKMKNPQQKVKLNSEASEFAWLTISEIKKLPVLPKTIEVAELVEKNCYNPVR
jgi:mutator protein MutT